MDRLRLLTINIWNRQGPWEERRRVLRMGLAALDADVVALQEVLSHESEPRNQAHELAIGRRSVYFADCFGLAGGGAPGFTFARSNHFAQVAHEPDRRIDYIFVRGPDRTLRGEPLEARLAFTVPDGDVFASDHYGVYAE